MVAILKLHETNVDFQDYNLFTDSCNKKGVFQKLFVINKVPPFLIVEWNVPQYTHSQHSLFCSQSTIQVVIINTVSLCCCPWYMGIVFR